MMSGRGLLFHTIQDVDIVPLGQMARPEWPGRNHFTLYLLYIHNYILYKTGNPDRDLILVEILNYVFLKFHATILMLRVSTRLLIPAHKPHNFAWIFLTWV